jgi:hypothetical protein
MIDINKGYGILVFYGILAIICAAIGNYWDKKNGFSNGYVVGNILSLVLWFTVGRAAAKA